MLKLKAFKFNRSFDNARPERIQDVVASCFHDLYKLTTTIVKNDLGYPFYKATCEKTGEHVCVKVIDKRVLERKEINRVINEFRNLRELRHENIVAVRQIFNEEDQVFVVYEHFEGESLADRLLEEKFVFSENDIKMILRKVCSALSVCKEEHIVHRNIRPESILFYKKDGKEIVKLVDFEWSTKNSNLMKTKCGVPSYLAPEILSRPNYNFKCDVWSLGVVTFLLLSNGQLPFSNCKNSTELLRAVGNGRWSFKPENTWRCISEEAKDFILHMLDTNPRKRFDYKQLLSHRFLVENRSRLSTKMVQLDTRATRASIQVKRLDF